MLHPLKTDRLVGRAAAGRQSITASKSYTPTNEYIFAPRAFTELAADTSEIFYDIGLKLK